MLLSGTITGPRAGLRGGFVEVRGGMLERQFLLRSRATVDASATLRLTGPHLPLNGATLALQRDATLELTGLDEAAARSRVLNRVESSGSVEVTPVAGAGIAVRVR